MASYDLAASADETERYRRQAEAARRRESELWARAGIEPGARVIDLGCGIGEVLAQYADVVGAAGLVVGVDRDRQALDRARERLRAVAPPVELHEGELAAEPPAELQGRFDVVSVRTVLAWNGGRESEILRRSRDLLRPGGRILVTDVDLTAMRVVPDVCPHRELYPAYLRHLTGRGHDPAVGLRLGDLLQDAGFEVEEFAGSVQILPRRPGSRGPAWAAREAMLDSGVIDRATAARWDREFTALDAAERQPRLFLTGYRAVGRVG